MGSQTDLINLETPTKREKENADSFHNVSGDFFQKAKIYDVEDGRESLMLLKSMEDFDVGRESLGLIHLSLNETERLSDANWLNIPNINVGCSSPSFANSTGVSNILNNGFLHPNRTGASVSISSYNSMKSSISSGRFDLSALSSIENSDVFVNSDLNKAFINSCSIDRRYSSELSNFRNRLCSLPVIMEKNSDACPLPFVKPESIIRRSLNLPRFDDEDDDVLEMDTKFNDSVFIEARMIASKIADGSILEDNGDIGLLDSTPQPDFLDDSDDQETNKNVKLTSEDIFKKVDKMLPMCSLPKVETPEGETKDNQTPPLHQNVALSNSQSSSNSANTISPTVQKLECFQNLSNIFQNKSLSKSLSTSKLSNGSGRSRSRDAKEILDNLSDILSNENPTLQQKAEGQNLLYSLADILYDSKTSSKSRETLDDSGHSSIEIEQDAEVHNDPKFVDIMELTTKPLCDTAQHDVPGPSQKKLNRSLSCPSTRQPVLSKLPTEAEGKVAKTGEGSNILNRISKSQASLPKLSSFGKLKSKKTEDTKKKGPLRAILPIGNMAKAITKSKTMGTPPKPAASSLYRNKTTSTPKRESTICPVAQSTPDDNSNDHRSKIQLSPSHLPKPRFSCPVSPLARPVLKEPRHIPSSAHNAQNASLNRRKSASDIKPLSNSMGLRRSNSISKDSNVASAVSRVKDSILRHTKEAAVDRKVNKSEVPQRPSQMDRLKSTVKPFNLMSKIRRSAGKENVDH